MAQSRDLNRDSQDPQGLWSRLRNLIDPVLSFFRQDMPSRGEIQGVNKSKENPELDAVVDRLNKAQYDGVTQYQSLDDAIIDYDRSFQAVNRERRQINREVEVEMKLIKSFDSRELSNSDRNRIDNRNNKLQDLRQTNDQKGIYQTLNLLEKMIPDLKAHNREIMASDQPDDQKKIAISKNNSNFYEAVYDAKRELLEAANQMKSYAPSLRSVERDNSVTHAPLMFKHGLEDSSKQGREDFISEQMQKGKIVESLSFKNISQPNMGLNQENPEAKLTLEDFIPPNLLKEEPEDTRSADSISQFNVEVNQEDPESKLTLEDLVEPDLLKEEAESPLSNPPVSKTLASSKVDVLKVIQNTNAVMAFATSLEALEPGGLDRLEGIEVENLGITDSGAQRTVIRDSRDADKARTYNLDTFSDTGTMRLSSPQAGSIFAVESTGQIVVQNLDQQSKGLINTMATLDNQLLLQKLGINQESAQSKAVESEAINTSRDNIQPPTQDLKTNIEPKKKKDIEL